MREVTADPKTPVPDAAPVAEPLAEPPLQAGAAEPRGGRWLRRGRRLTWRAPVTVVLLGLLAAAVALILLQSAGVIDWGFLGPTA